MRAYAALWVVGLTLALAPIGVSACKLLQSDPALVTDVGGLALCVQSEVVAGDTDMLTIAAKCFNKELQLAYDFVRGLFGLPSFTSSVPADKLAALKASHVSLGLDLKSVVRDGGK